MKFLLILILALAALAQSTISGGGKVSGTVSVGGTAPTGGGSLTVTVAGLSSTQALLTYTAPDANACTDEISESATYSPLVHDVAAAKFTGANLDSRSSGVSVGTARIFVAGSRLPAVALDASVYSRALQANTLHYYRVTCGGSVGTGTFTTQNIPVGDTSNETPPADPSTPGGWLLPTRDGTRTQVIIDPQKGTQLSPVSLPGDQQGGSPGVTIYTGASARSCNPTLHTAPGGAQGYLCNLDDTNGYHSLYFLVPATGEVRHLGLIPLTPNPTVGDDLKTYSGDSTQDTPSGGTYPIQLGNTSFGTGDSSPLFAGLRVKACRGTAGSDSTFSNGSVDLTKCMLGTVVSYGSNQLVVNVDTLIGTGTYTPWVIIGIDNVFSYDYTGNYVHQGGPTPIALSAPTLQISPSGGTLMHNFDPTFDTTFYSCNKPGAPAGAYSPVVCGSGQDGQGQIGIFYGGDGRSPIPSSCAGGDTECPRIVFIWDTFRRPESKFCGIHQIEYVPNTNLLAVNWHGLSTNGEDVNKTTPGIAPIKFVLAADAVSGTRTVTVAAPPASIAIPADPVAAPAPAAGDRIRLNSTGQLFVLAAVSGNTWTTTTDIGGTAASGTEGQMTCNVAPSENDGVWSIRYYDYSDATGATAITDTKFPGGGHMDVGPLGRVSEASNGYGFVLKNAGTIYASLDTPMTLVPSTAAFNGIAPPGFGNLLTKHPSYQQTNTDPWFFDRVAFGGGDPSSGSSSGGRYYSAATGAALMSGQLYQYFPDTAFPLARKLISTQASSGGKSLRDISGPGSVLSNGSGDSYKYCVAYKANECVSGSSATNSYFNVPGGLDYLYCSGGDPVPTNRDACITNMPVYSGAMMQFGMGSDSADSTAKSRNLSGGLVGPKSIFVYPLAKATALAEYALFTIGIVINGNPGGVNGIDTWKVKLPPLPAPDGIDRTAFIPTSVVVPSGSQNNVVVRFWYTENNGYCGSRAEDCYATAASIPGGADPYKYPSDGTAGTLATVGGLACSGGCTVAVPAVSQHMMYYQVVYRDASNAVLSLGSVGVVAIP